MDFLSTLRAYAPWATALVCLYSLLKAVYNVYFHPLSRFPGPKLAAASLWWQAYLDLWENGSLSLKLVELHATYGEIVRIGPNELHFSRPSAFHEIYNSRNRWSKGSYLYDAFVDTKSRSMFSILDYESAKKRSELTTNIFSRKSIIAMQNLVQECVDGMCANIDDHIANKRPVHFRRAFRCCTLDSICSLCFGRTTHALGAPEFRSPIEHALGTTLPIRRLAKHIPFLMTFLRILPPSLFRYLQPYSEGYLEVVKILSTQIREIFANPQSLANSDHPTVYHELMKAKDQSILTEEAFLDEGFLFLFAGTDTSSNALSVGTLHVLGDPQVYAKLMNELLEAWPRLDDRLRYETLESLPYLRAVVKESLRVSHGVVTPLTRVVPSDGAVISGKFIPGGTVVSMSNVLVHTNEEIFPEPHAFKPERWLDPAAGSLDNWLVSFSKGPRSCIGINLAYCEMYLAFANLFRRYDMRLNGVSPSDWRWVDHFLPVYSGSAPLELWAQARLT
ncbi:uncharacterized protein PHACADRAFT_193681 [Phanerochaete carnosa HHB-10118-sp]|uniref:Cytochrome P450 n=1 Tax=Phanerochaete carnosa (strain HHB-10118-sp) TaxID=650164 RepID=K5WGU1_PHACS|nr:uncharacterized protein PHACADRAFT_193681 [Phanerochaete carnosa HHB-10118-sp]EKM58550.1 hypothetical protein PHACADRAFT_193681 [Phanerochaete carnosa HHB-10118-sp]